MNRLSERHGFAVVLLLGVVIVIYALAFMSLSFLLVGAALTIVGAYGKGIRFLKLTREGIEFRTWRERLIRRIATRLQLEPAQLSLEGQLAHVKIGAADAGHGSETTKTIGTRFTLEKAHEAASPEELADRVLELLDAHGGVTAATPSGSGQGRAGALDDQDQSRP